MHACQLIENNSSEVHYETCFYWKMPLLPGPEVIKDKLEKNKKNKKKKHGNRFLKITAEGFLLF